MIDERAYYQHWKKYEEDKAKAEELRKTLRELMDDPALSDDHRYKRALVQKLITHEEYRLLQTKMY